MNRWAKAGVLDRVFQGLQEHQVIQVKAEAISLDSTAVKVHPDGMGALKKTANKSLVKVDQAGPPHHTVGIDSSASSYCITPPLALIKPQAKMRMKANYQERVKQNLLQKARPWATIWSLGSVNN